MAKISFEGLEAVEYPHQFEIELNCLAVVNHQLTLQAIDSCENDDLNALGVEEYSEDPDFVRSRRASVQDFFDRLRAASNNQAAVALVALLQHWFGRLAHKTPETIRKHKSRMLNGIDRLNKHVGDGPVPVAFFSELEDVRDSVIHADSNVEWEYQGARRRVAVDYANGWSTEMTEAHLKDAIEKAIEQVKYYDEKLHSQP